MPTRRFVLQQLGLGISTAILASCAGRQAKEPPVWLDMDQQALNDAYSQSNFAPNINQVIERWAVNSALVRDRLGSPQRFAYGPGDVEQLDVFPTSRNDAPIHVFVHGGAWRGGRAENYAFPAETFVNAGIHYVVPDFSWVQDVGDSLYPIVDQLRRAVAWVHRNAGQFGGNPDRIFLSGHSSGGHLAGVLLTTDWQTTMDLPPDVIKAGLCASGMFDLRPVRLSSRGDYIAFTDAMENDLSAIRHIDALNVPLVVAYGSLESPEFIRQSEEFAAAVERAGKPVQLVRAEHYNHVEILDTLANPYGILGRAALLQVAAYARGPMSG